MLSVLASLALLGSDERARRRACSPLRPASDAARVVRLRRRRSGWSSGPWPSSRWLDARRSAQRGVIVDGSAARSWRPSWLTPSSPASIEPSDLDRSAGGSACADPRHRRLRAALGDLLARRAPDRGPTGLFAGHVNIWGDWPVHLGIVSSFAYGANFPPEHPRFADHAFAYHYLSDLTAAAPVTLGMDPGRAGPAQLRRVRARGHRAVCLRPTVPAQPRRGDADPDPVRPRRRPGLDRHRGRGSSRPTIWSARSRRWPGIATSRADLNMQIVNMFFGFMASQRGVPLRAPAGLRDHGHADGRRPPRGRGRGCSSSPAHRRAPAARPPRHAARPGDRHAVPGPALPRAVAGCAFFGVWMAIAVPQLLHPARWRRRRPVGDPDPARLGGAARSVAVVLGQEPGLLPARCSSAASWLGGCCRRARSGSRWPSWSCSWPSTSSSSSRGTGTTTSCSCTGSSTVVARVGGRAGAAVARADHDAVTRAARGRVMVATMTLSGLLEDLSTLLGQSTYQHAPARPD